MDQAVAIWRNSSLQKYILATMSPIGMPLISAPKMVHSDNPANHFLPSFSRIMAKGYNPTLEDILCVRIPTTGMMRSHLIKI